MRRFALLAIAVFAACVAASSATATSQQRYALDFMDIPPPGAVHICPFEVSVVGHVTGYETDHYNDNGELVKIELTGKFVNTYSANGKTLVGESVETNGIIRFDPDGNLISAYYQGVYERVRLPDGELWTTAGRVNLMNFAEETWIFEPDNGHWSDPAPLCAALS